MVEVDDVDDVEVDDVDDDVLLSLVGVVVSLDADVEITVELVAAASSPLHAASNGNRAVAARTARTLMDESLPAISARGRDGCAVNG